MKDSRRVSGKNWNLNRLAPTSALVLVAAAAMAGCVEPYNGTTGTTDSDTSDMSATESGMSDGVMTSTSGSNQTSSSSSPGTETGSTSQATTGDPIGPYCGDGTVDVDEECDDGELNADNADCTLECKAAVCGDGLTNVNVESCDDGTNNGKYSFCNTDCTGLGPHCGDGIEQTGQGEECDAPIQSGCLMNCSYARSCQDIKDDGDHGDGQYPLHPDDIDLPVTVYCDLETDGARGFTFLKVHVADENENPLFYSAAQADNFCSTYGMDLLVTRDGVHLGAAFRAAAEVPFDPVGNGSETTSKKYLSILGVQPKTEGVSCAGEPFNSEVCPEWEAHNGGPFFVSATPIANQPGITNCEGCSPVYYWNDEGTLTSMETFSNDGKGGTSEYFMCDLGEQ